jgi:uncharacterized protein (TIGR03083 family)
MPERCPLRSQLNELTITPVPTAHLFAPLGRELLILLKGLPADAWNLPTSAPRWSVRDVVAHLLDVDYRRLSMMRDGYFPPPPETPIHSYGDLVAYLNHLNAEWVAATRRLSPRLLVDSLEQSTAGVASLMDNADPDAEALFPVAWTGQSRSPMWLDVGREYTERWHHQDQIRDAVDAPPLSDVEWLRPVIRISLLVLPHAYREVVVDPGTELELRVAGPAGGEWHLRAGARWQLYPGAASNPVTVVEVADLSLARILLHRLTPAAAASSIRVSGQADLAEPVLTARAVMT